MTGKCRFVEEIMINFSALADSLEAIDVLRSRIEAPSSCLCSGGSLEIDCLQTPEDVILRQPTLGKSIRLLQANSRACFSSWRQLFTAASNMRWLFSFLLLALLGVVQALSSSGDRLLVVLEELAEKDKYSEFWEDLQCGQLQSSTPSLAIKDI